MRGDQQFEENPTGQQQDYDSWVNSLGNIQDGIFQNTPITNHTIHQQQQHQQQQSYGPNQPINFNSNTPLIHHQINQNQAPTGIAVPDASNIDFFFNSPDRFYRDIINESPILNKTPYHDGRTPLKNLNMSFSTPLFLRNMENNSLTNSGIKNFTPLKNQLFPNIINNSSNKLVQNLEIFQTPNDKSQSSILNSSPTTIKMNSSAIKDDSNQSSNNDSMNKTGNKILPMSPTPISKIQQISPIIPSGNQTLVPKMGCFKKNSPKKKKPIKFPKQPIITTHALVNNNKSISSNANNNNTKFQIIMTDVNSFASSQNKSRRRKKLTRSSTQINTSALNNNSNNSNNNKNGNVNKKLSLKRSISQPPALLSKLNDSNQSINLLNSSSSDLSQNSIIKKDQDMPLQEKSEQQINRRNSPIKKFTELQVLNSNFIQVEDLFDDRVLNNQENMKW